MPYFRIRASDGKIETVFEEKFRDEARLREVLPKRGWVNVISIEEIPDPATEPAKEETVVAGPPIAIAPGQMRTEGSWAFLAPEIARQHPLYGFGGWAIVLLVWIAFFIVLNLALAALLIMAAGHSTATWVVWVASALAGGLILIALGYGLAVYQLATEKRAFSATFTAMATLSLPVSLVSALAFVGAGLTIDFSLVWLIYVLQSRRINVTYFKRVYGDDPFVRRLQSASR